MSISPRRFQDYDEMLDEDIVLVAREGSTEALEYLINKYRNFVRAKARSYFLIGADREDIIIPTISHKIVLC